jgi:hypothetical protein
MLRESAECEDAGRGVRRYRSCLGGTPYDDDYVDGVGDGSWQRCETLRVPAEGC